VSFLAPERLAALAVVLALGLAYASVRRGRARHALRFSRLELLDRIAPCKPGWRRHLTSAGLMLALVGLVLAIAQPVRTATVARPEAVLVLAIDTSLSMRATDVQPSRLEAARDAATRFLDDLPSHVSLGVVAFDGTARLLLAPTQDRAAARTAIDRLELGPGTAIGDAIAVGLDVIPTGTPVGEDPTGQILLLSDGQTTGGLSNETATALARERGVPVSTIAYGTSAGTLELDGETIPVPVDSLALEAIAIETGGKAAEASSASALGEALNELGRVRVERREQRDLVLWFVTCSFALACAATVGSLRWFARFP
jgi:Ca-activated chloride channel family protein